MESHYTKSFDAVLKQEKEHINGSAERKGSEIYKGLALSGGGIRSSSFCLGILQALAGNGLLREFDYLSSASGGGYIGSSLTWLLRGKHEAMSKNPKHGEAEYGVNPENFPFGTTNNDREDSPQPQKGNTILDFVRQHGNYLDPARGVDLSAFVSYVIRTSLVSLLIYFSIFTLILLLLRWAGIFSTSVPIPDFLRADGTPIVVSNLLLLASLVLAGFFILSGILHGLLSRLLIRGHFWSYRYRIYNQLWLGNAAKIFIATSIVGTLPLVHGLLLQLHMQIQAAGIFTLLGAFIGWYREQSLRRSIAGKNSKGGNLLVISASLLVIYGLMLGAHSLVEILLRQSLATLVLSIVALVFTAVWLGFITNINAVSSHRIYRDRLMEAFMPDRENIEGNQWGPARAANAGLLEDMCGAPNQRPYHLINTNLILVNSPSARYRQRGGDSFTLSPLHCGSDATGWRRTGDYMKKTGGGLTLATAMAVSGAALNPNAGNSGRGVTRNRWVSILFTLLNLRLGYWVQHPNPKRREWRFFSRSFLGAGLLQGILGLGHKEDTAIVELSDGGHFDNLALYELIRRQLDVILVCDSGADPDYAFGDLSSLIERVRVDFGVKIRFEQEYPLHRLVPGSAEQDTDGEADEKYRPAASAIARARIEYPGREKKHGQLLYVKATLIDALPVDLLSYRKLNPDYPHETTADQFFTEMQVEAYRRLGYRIGDRLTKEMLELTPAPQEAFVAG